VQQEECEVKNKQRGCMKNLIGEHEDVGLGLCDSMVGSSQ
jgi:hypothetical protein